MQQNIEKYFTHRWEHYKNLAFQTDEEVALLNELPDDVKNDLFSLFLFESFIKVFHCNFSVQIPNSYHSMSYFNWGNPVYAHFMTDLMQKMEPTFSRQNQIIYHELDEITEVVFYYDGKFDLGYEINGKNFYVLRYQNSS